MTIINNTHKFIFVHIPKNAGTTVNEVLARYTGWNDLELGGTDYGEVLAAIYWPRFRIGKHTRARGIRRTVGEAVWQDYFTFAFVRNPYARTFSVYRFLKRWRNWDGSEVMDKFNSFEDFLGSEFFQRDEGPDAIFLPQHIWLEGEDNQIIVDYTGKVEEIGTAFRHLGSRVGIAFEEGQIPVMNDSGDPAEFRTAYSERAIAIVRERYNRDFQLFDYSPAFATTIDGESARP